MTKLPRRHIEPLDPTPDSFDRVLRSARRRRRRTAVVAASSTLTIALVAAGSFALGSSLNGTQNFNQAADNKGNSANTPDPVQQSSRTPSVHRKKTQPPAIVTSPATGAPISLLRGRVVDGLGNGLANIYVVPGVPDHLTYSPDSARATRTDSEGFYAIPCPRAPVLVATWLLNDKLDARSTGGDYGSTFVGGTATTPVVPHCGKTAHDTMLTLGATLHGTVHVPASCAPGTTFPVWVWLNGDRARTVRLYGLRDGDTFTFSGLPPGTHTLGAHGNRTSITLAAGDSHEQDATFATCSGGQTPGTPTQSSSPTPTETPTPTPTPTPTSTTPTPTPTPTPTIS